MLFPEHHWSNYPEALQDHIQHILLPPMIHAPSAPQPVQIAQTAPIGAQMASLAPAAQLLATVPMDVQPPQILTTSEPNLDRHGQPIPKPTQYEHSVKRKTQQQKEVEYCNAHKTQMADEPQA
uniref:Amelogenin n=1 Tax=Romanomermis culicivorax TaxID=13658 RepID=A0A915L9X6_ROMCU